MAMADSEHQIKIAAYKSSFPKNVSVDWCLDALLNIYDPRYFTVENDNLSIYYDQIKAYAPDLIISDLEYFTSYIALALNIPLWQYSASMINFALTRNEKYDLGLFKFYAHLLNRDPMHNQRTLNIIDNSQYNFVYSHYGDIEKPPSIQDNYKWIRPYHEVYKPYAPCKHNIVAAIPNNKTLFNELKKYKDGVVFTDACCESYENLILKDIENVDEYYCNLKNSEFFVCQGQTSFMADAFYNGTFSFIWPDYRDIDSVINSQLAQKMKLGSIISSPFDFDIICEVKSNYNDTIKYLHEWIKEEL